MDNIEWEIGVLLHCFAEKFNKLGEYDFDEEDRLKDLYAKAIILNVKDGYGLFYPIDDFIESVEGGGYIDYDGIGFLLNGNGEKIGHSRCNVQFLEEAKANGAVYVAWYNK